LYSIINTNDTSGDIMKGKIDINKVVKKSSREYFAGIDTRTKVIRDKTKYNRKNKHKNNIDTI